LGALPEEAPRLCFQQSDAAEKENELAISTLVIISA
jgi:hypothetical protein